MHGIGTLIVTFGRASASGPTPSAGQDAAAFPCSPGGGAPMRHEIAADLGSGEIIVSGGVVPGAGELAPSSFMVSLEEAAS